MFSSRLFSHSSALQPPASGYFRHGTIALLVLIAEFTAGQEFSSPNLTELNRGDVAATVPITSRSKDGSSEYRAEINLGRVRAGAKLNTSFLLSNEKELVLRFDRVKTTCSCVQAKIPRKPIERRGD